MADSQNKTSNFDLYSDTTADEAVYAISKALRDVGIKCKMTYVDFEDGHLRYTLEVE